MASKKRSRQLRDSINTIHDLVIESTDDPRPRRQGKDLLHAAMVILHATETTINPHYQAAMIYQELAQGHYFIDGNKRTAHITAKSHLLFSGYHLKVRYKWAVPFIEQIASGEKDLVEIVEWIEEHSIKYRKRKTFEDYLKKVMKEATVQENRGRPLKDGGKRFH